MRMWMIDPSKLCNKHLLGEHVELHMLEGSLRKNKKLGKLLTKGFVDPSSVEDRHTVISQEMINRGMNHKSPLECKSEIRNKIDTNQSIMDLKTRCKKCEEKINSI